MNTNVQIKGEDDLNDNTQRWLLAVSIGGGDDKVGDAQG